MDEHTAQYPARDILSLIPEEITRECVAAVVVPFRERVDVSIRTGVSGRKQTVDELVNTLAGLLVVVGSFHERSCDVSGLDPRKVWVQANVAAAHMRKNSQDPMSDSSMSCQVLIDYCDDHSGQLYKDQ